MLHPSWKDTAAANAAAYRGRNLNNGNNFMSAKHTPQKPLRIALLLAWRNKGYSQPRYGLVDDEELLLTGRASFLGTDGLRVAVIPGDLLLLQQPTPAAMPETTDAVSSRSR